MRARFILSFLLLTLLATFAGAQCIVRNRIVAAQAAVVAAPAVVVPAYGAAYDASAVEVQKIKEQLAAYEARLATLEKALRLTAGAPTEKPFQDAPPKDDAPKAGGLPGAVSRSCVKCHQAGKAPKGGLALVDATGWKLATLSCEQRLEVLRRINLEASDPAVMPPKGKGDAPVSDKEAAELLEVMTKPK
jgi:mono/diheme cytochrome c family protein